MSIVEFSIPSRIIFGSGSVSKLADIVGKYGGRTLIITDGKSFQQTGIIDKIISDLHDKFINAIVFSEVSDDSTSETADNAAHIAKFSGADSIIAFGGFRVQNIAKAAAVVVTNSGEASDYVSGQPVYHKPIPVIAVPTIYGSIAEISTGLCIFDRYDKSNKQVESKYIYSSDCIIDADLYATIPIKYMVSSAMSVFALSFDLYMSNSLTNISDTLISRAMSMSMDDLKNLAGGTVDNLSNLSSANMLCAVASCHSKFGAIRALSIAMNSVFGLNMSMFSSIILPYIMERYIPIVPDKYAYFSEFMSDIEKDFSALEVATKSTQIIKGYIQNLNLPTTLSELSIKRTDFPAVAKLALNYPGMDELPSPMTEESIITLLEQAF